MRVVSARPKVRRNKSAKSKFIPSKTFWPTWALGVGVDGSAVYGRNAVHSPSGENAPSDQASNRRQDDTIEETLWDHWTKNFWWKTYIEYINFQAQASLARVELQFATKVFSHIEKVNSKYLAKFALFRMRTEMTLATFYRHRFHINSESMDEEIEMKDTAVRFLFLIIFTAKS